MDHIKIRKMFEVDYQRAADRNKVFVHFDLNNVGEYAVIGVRLAFEAYQAAVDPSAILLGAPLRETDTRRSEEEIQSALREKFQCEYDGMCSWRSRWTKLASDFKRGLSNGVRLQSTQERIERRASIANANIARLLATMEAERAKLSSPVALANATK